MTSISVSPDWVLYQDWCAAADLPSLPTTAAAIAQFLQDAPAAQSTQAKRVQAIRRAHREAGAPLALPTHEPQTSWRVGRAWLDLPTTLNRIPLEGWPTGLVGRRDAFLAVLIGACGFSREEARTVAATDIEQDREANWRIRGHLLPRTVGAGPCPACAAARWMEILDLWDGWGRSSVRQHVAGYRRTDEHACLGPSPHQGLMLHTLLPGIDRHGWLADWEPMTARSISAVLAYRQDAAQWPFDPDPVQIRERPVEERPDYQRESMQTLTELLDALDVKVVAALRQSAQIVADGG